MLCFSTLIAHGQKKLFIYEKNGSIQSFALSDIKKLTFTEYDMRVEQKEASAAYIWIENIAFLNFQTSVNILDNQMRDISIFPNPVTNHLTVKNSEIIDELKIFDIQGKQYLHLSPKKKIVDIDMTSFSAGIYFLQIICNNRISTSKIIKNTNN